ncbi:MAG: arylesterase [Desulfohalobiaceae bacterium]
MTKTILALGDSLCAGFGLPLHSSFASQLQKALQERNYEVRIINAGISGDSTAGGLARADRELKKAPDLVFLELGINDAAMGEDPARIRANLESIINKIRAKGVEIILAGTDLPPEFGSQRRQEYSQVFHSLAQEYQLPLIPDLLAGVPGNPELTLPDGLHPNATGVQKMLEHALPVVEKTLQNMQTIKG